MSTKNVKYFVEDNKKILETVSEMRLGITTLTADLVCRDTIAMKICVGKQEGGWAEVGIERPVIHGLSLIHI